MIGEVIAEPVYRVTEGDREWSPSFPGRASSPIVPSTTPEARESDEIRSLRARDVHGIAERPEERNATWTLEQLLSSPTIASKAWVFRQYDSTVRTGTVVGPGSDAAVVRLRGTDRRLRSRPIAMGATSISIRAWADESRSPRRRATSRAPERARSRSPIASISAIRGARRFSSSSARRWREWAKRAGCSAHLSRAATSRSTTRARAARSTPRPSSGWSG